MTDTKKKIDSRRCEDVLQAAEELFAKSPDWVAFFREVLGLGGIARRTFPAVEQLAEFEHSDAYREIQRMLTRLRAQPVRPQRKKTEARDLKLVSPEAEGRETAKTPKAEETKVITVRLPASLLEALQEEAHEHRTSVNKLCISKLLQYIDHDLIPARQSGVQEGTL
jgi:predicted HicB family RNase H-like nuclease